MAILKFETLKIKIKLTKEMLGTNPIDPAVMDTHILDRQRKLIAEKSSVNKAINKYLDAKTISEERGALELKALRGTIEELLGSPLTDDEYESLKKGEFKKLTDLRESMKELEMKGITCFFRDGTNIAIGSHMILGFMKAAGESIGRTRATKKGTILQSTAYTQSIINQHVSIFPDLITASKDIKRNEDMTPSYLQRSLRAMTPLGPRVSLAKSEQLPKETEFEFEIKMLSDSPLKKSHIEEIFSYGQLKGLGQWRNAGHGQFEVISIE